MLKVFIGQRGVGKTSLLNRLAGYLQDLRVDDSQSEVAANFIDLDQRLEQKLNKSVADIFKQEGEDFFRSQEQLIFGDILTSLGYYKHTAGVAVHNSNHVHYLVVGAGFDTDPWIECQDIEWIWLRRPSDELGRIFFDRPRLNPDVDELSEWQHRSSQREFKWQKLRALEVEIPEGLDHPCDFEQSFWCWLLSNLKTFDPNVLPHAQNTIRPRDQKIMVTLRPGSDWFYHYLERLVAAKIMIELRDDLVSADTREELLAKFGREPFFLSHRVQDAWPEWRDYDDCDYSLISSDVNYQWCSHHELKSNGVAAWQFMTELEKSTHKNIKWAPIVETWDELMLGHQWQQASPTTRAFLPRSANGRWLWYRQLQALSAPLVFYRFFDHNVRDQPYLFDLFMWSGATEKEFAAILGDPVAHSRTPFRHREFFLGKRMRIVAISIRRTEPVSQIIEWLRSIGLKSAAVTSPLKELVGAGLSGAVDRRSMNTVAWDAGGAMLSSNTDEFAIAKLADQLKSYLCVAIWGGGGVLAALKSSWPEAHLFSARSGQYREVKVPQCPAHELRPDLVIWAAPNFKNLKLPPPEWQPALVWDLNYSWSSRGREYAKICGASYTNGEAMFDYQAQAQQQFWRKYL